MIDLTRGKADSFLARRYAVEKRFKFYGALALALTTVFLAFLLADIVSKGLPAFTEHRAKLEVLIDPARIDAAAPLSGDYEGVLKDALRAQFPEMGARADRKKLNSVLSRGAADDLRDLVAAKPSLVGQTAEFEVLLSDESDLYFKGLAPSKDAALLDKVEIRASPSSPVCAALLSDRCSQSRWHWDWGCRLASPPPSISSSLRLRTAGLISLRSTSTIWPPCLPSYLGFWAWPCS
jgi:Domain of unknown function (DUF3333)